MKKNFFFERKGCLNQQQFHSKLRGFVNLAFEIHNFAREMKVL